MYSLHGLRRLLCLNRLTAATIATAVQEVFAPVTQSIADAEHQAAAREARTAAAQAPTAATQPARPAAAKTARVERLPDTLSGRRGAGQAADSRVGSTKRLQTDELGTSRIVSLRVCAMLNDRSGGTSVQSYDVLGLVTKEDVMENSTEKQVFWVNVLVKDPALPGERFDGGLRMEIHMWPLLEVNDVRSQVEAGCLVATHCFYVNENLLPVFWDRLVTKSWGADLQALETYTVTNLQLQGLLSENSYRLLRAKQERIHVDPNMLGWYNKPAEGLSSARKVAHAGPRSKTREQREVDHDVWHKEDLTGKRQQAQLPAHIHKPLMVSWQQSIRKCTYSFLLIFFLAADSNLFMPASTRLFG